MAQGALVQLAELTASTTSFNTKIKEATLAVESFAARTGMSVSKVKTLFRSVDEEFAQAKNASVVFGGTGSAAWNQVGQAAASTEQKVGQSSRGIVGHINTIRIAMGILISMLIHQVLQAFRQMVDGAINGLRELELATYNLINAERILSEQGVDITPKGLDSFIKELQELDPLLSKIQASELVSRIARNVAPAVGFNLEQIKQLSKAVAIFAIQNKALGYTFEEVEKQMTEAFTTGRVSQAINKLGIKINDQIVRDEALRLGLVKTAEEFDRLSGKVEAQVKAQAMLSLINAEAEKSVSHLPEYFRTADASFGVFQARLSDLLATIGVQFGPLLIELFQGLAQRLEDLNRWLTENEGRINNFVALLSGVTSALLELNNIQWEGKFLSPIENSKRVWQAFIEGVQGAQKSTTDLGNALDTPTAAVEGLNAAVEQFDASNMIDEIEDIIQKTQEEMQDLDIDLGRKAMDIDIEYDRKAEDALLDFNRKVEDIQQDTENKIAEIKQKRRDEDVKREQEYQNKLWELQQQYLMDLEEALHARDARQILRLQRQYEFEKEKLARQNELEAQESKRGEGSDIRKVRQEQKEKIEEARIHYQQELDDLNVAKARELADLQTWYDRQQEDLKLAQDRKLQALMEGWAEEQKLTEANAQAVYNILYGYFGPGGLTDQLYTYMAQSLANQSALAAAGMNTAGVGEGIPLGMENAPVSTYGLDASGLGSASGGAAPTYPVWNFPGGLAEGGSFLATTPQSLNVAENGPELISATPLGRIGRDINKLFLGTNRGNEGGGTMEIGVTLSPDLEARVIRKTLDETAGVVLKVNRTKI